MTILTRSTYRGTHKVRWLACALIALVAACVSSAPRAIANETAVQITGEFLADGSCHVSANGASLYAESEQPQTIYIRGRALNMAPDGYEVHEIWCALPTSDEPMLPSQPRERAFFVNVYAPTDSLAPARRYVVVRGMPLIDVGGTTAVRANVSLFGSPTDSGPASAVGTTYLTGAGGYVTLTHVDSTLVVGTFKVLGVRERSMM